MNKDEFKVSLPKLGESILSATIVQWFKQVGDPVERDEPLLEVSTDKVNSEIPAPISGILQEILAQPSQELQVGDPLAIIATGTASAPAVSQKIDREKPVVDTAHESSAMSGFFSPAILRLAQEKGVAFDELGRIPKTGSEGRLTKKDLEIYLEQKSRAPRPCPAQSPKAIVEPMGADVERVKMSGMRKAIADNMVRSFYQAPHASLIAEVDVTAALQIIQKEKEAFASKYGAKLTITPFVARALAKALQEFPLLNSSLEQDTIVVKRFVNLGIAVSVDQGLMVPVVKNCQKMALSEIAKSIGELSTKARSGKLSPDDVAEGTITMTNFGMSGVLIGVPIIRYPEVAIVGIGAIHKKVIPLENDLLAIRSMMHVCLTFDHRVLDGMYGCGYLAALKRHLETDTTID